MAKKKEKPRLNDASRERLRRVTLQLLALVAITAVIGLGYYKVYRYVDRNVAYSAEPPRVVLKDRPVWMSDFLAEQICSAAQPPGSHSALNGEMLRTAKVMLENNARTNAWIKKINQLRLVYGKRPGDTLVLDCEFRAPVAMVHYHDHYYLVDGDGISLPERYSADQVSKIVYGANGKMNIRVVEGIRSGPPLPGDKWQGNDLVAALDMVKVLYGKDFAQEVIKVDISNFDGRQDARDAQILLVTTRNTQIRWGRPVMSTDLAEIPSGQKLANLQRVFAMHGHIDAGLPWIDVRFDRVSGPADVAATASSAPQ